MPETEDLLYARRIGALIEEATYGGGTDSKASEEAEIRAGGSHLGSKEAQGVSQSEVKLFVLCPNGQFD